MALYSTLTTLNNNITPNPSVNVTGAKTITSLAVDTSLLTSDGEFRNISVNGTPGSIFSLTIEDKNGKNVLPYSNRINKIVKTAVSASNTLELNNASGLEVGMVLLNNQRRNVKIKAGLSATLKPSSFIMSSIQFLGGMTGLGLGKTKSDFAFGSGNINSAITLPV